MFVNRVKFDHLWVFDLPKTVVVGDIAGNPEWASALQDVDMVIKHGKRIK